MTPLFVVATIMLFLGIDWLVQRGQAKKRATASDSLLIQGDTPYPLRTPEGIFFSKSHTWVSLFPSGKVRVGVDDFIANLLERAEITLVRDQGGHVEKGEPLLVLSESGQALTVRSPLSGEIVSVNDRLEERTGLRHADLFSDGWAYTIFPTKPEELRTLLIGSETRSWMSRELSRLRDFFANAAANGVLPAAMQDGGPPAPGALLHLGPEVWKRFENQFLQTD